ncbi:MAG TPA: hypothetical protein DEB21_04530 [Rhodospirillaceae bacterium]|nr:hypothetical protein [Magnetovibrio sp.]HBT41301.1 hypothetical protein [Rhodospirillaceae bacterium]
MFDTFQALVMDMQGKIMDASKTQQVASRDVARMDRPSDNRQDSYRDRSASRGVERTETEQTSRYQERKRQFGNDHEVSQSDDAGRGYGDDRRDGQSDVGATDRNSQADNDRGNSDGRRQDAVNRDGNANRDDQVQSTDSQSGTQDASAGGDAGNGNQAGTQPQTQNQGENATLVQASLAGSQADAVLATLATQAQGQDATKQATQTTQVVGDDVVETVKADPQAGQNQRALNHELIRANQQAQHIRNIANLQTNGQANGDGAKQAESLLQAQAGKIAEAVGGDAKLAVNVNVQDNAAMANGRPLSALSATSALAGSQQQSAQSGQQAQNAQQAQIQNPIAQAAMVQSHQNPVQGQAAQVQAQTGQATQAQTAAQITADAKGPVQASSGASNAGTHGANTSGDGNATQANANAGQTQSSHQAQQAQKTAHQQQPQHAAKNKVVDQVTVQINKAIKAGADKINIRLYPQHLGRVEVRLEVAHDGRTVAMVTADKPETLEMLRRDSDQLSKALQDAGLDMQSGDLNYNLKGQDDGNKQQLASGKTGGEEVEDDTLESDVMETAVAAHEMGVLHNGRVDVRA